MNNNPKGTGNQRQDQTQPTDSTAEQAWKDRAGIPRGTPEQGGKSADRVGGSGPSEPAPEIEEDDVEREGRRTVREDEDEDRKRV